MRLLPIIVIFLVGCRSAEISSTRNSDAISGNQAPQGQTIPPGPLAIVGPGSEEELDPMFESYWGGNAGIEKDAKKGVADVIVNFVKSAAESRKSNYANRQSAANISDKEQLPQRNNGEYATRDVHRRAHGCFLADVKFGDNIPEKYRKGLFQSGAHYDGIVRFSNGNPHSSPAVAPDARGLALKLLPSSYTSGADLTTEKINDDGLLDILTINFPTFFMDDPVQYAKVNRLFLTQDGVSPLAKLFREGKAAAIAGSPIKAVLALKVNGSIIKNFLFQEWFSMAPSRLGEPSDPERTAVKYMIAPCDSSSRGVESGEWPKWSTWERGRDYQLLVPQNFLIPKSDMDQLADSDRTYHRRKIIETLGRNPNGFCMSLYLQPYVSKNDTPIEDSTIVWNWSKEQVASWKKDPLLLAAAPRKTWETETRSVVAPIKVATITVKPPQGGAFLDKNLSNCEDLSFNPWNRVPEAHRPLGIVQRMKRTVYNASRSTRFRINGLDNGKLEGFGSNQSPAVPE
jgi:hypothetical protein